MPDRMGVSRERQRAMSEERHAGAGKHTASVPPQMALLRPRTQVDGVGFHIVVALQIEKTGEKETENVQSGHSTASVMICTYNSYMQTTCGIYGTTVPMSTYRPTAVRCC